MRNFLEEIIAYKKREIENAKEKVPVAKLEKNLSQALVVRDFERALSNGKPPRVIAEIKRRSPSKGDINPSLDARLTAQEYELGGASAISVLTDAHYFGGNLEDLRSAKEAVSIPMMRKDFILDEYQIVEARAWGADAILLIVCALSQGKLRTLIKFARELGLASLVEIHDENELGIALEAGARIIGINTRNLRTFEVDSSLPFKLKDKIPPSVTAVVESGIKTREDIQGYLKAGYGAFLIGEALAKAPDKIKMLSSLLS